MIANIPKTALCKECGQKPKPQIVSWSYGDSDDEFFLVHTCNGKPVRFPERGRFTENYVNGQRPKVIEAWNQLQSPFQEPREGERDGRTKNI